MFPLMKRIILLSAIMSFTGVGFSQKNDVVQDRQQSSFGFDYAQFSSTKNLDITELNGSDDHIYSIISIQINQSKSIKNS